LFHKSETDFVVPVESQIKTPELIKRLREHLKACRQLQSLEWHKNFGSSMAYLRDKKGVSLRQLSEGTGLNVIRLWRLEGGKAKWTEKLAEKYLGALE
jgi:ribosome-binding protein aMBF1 (putative translation factor)